jgi:acetolactate synthase-1/2/3 large subunit
MRALTDEISADCTATGADAIGRALAEAGATHAFGIPGGEVLALIDGLAGAGIEFVLARHENAAGFMAEGLWHATGALPVLVATLGPGVANAVNVVANAWQDRVPLIFLTGCVDGALARSYTHQVFDHQAVLRPVVKASLRAEAGSATATIAEAIAVALDGQLGPVHVDVPIGVAENAAGCPPSWPGGGAASPAPTDDEIATAADVLSRAERLLVIAGVDAVNAGAGADVAAFCGAQGAPLITTYKAKGLIDETDPLALGGAGLSPKADAILGPLIAAADAILLVGYDPIEMRVGWRNPWPADKAVVEIAPAPRRHGMHAVRHGLEGPVRPTLRRLARVVAQRPRWRDGAPAAARAALAAAFAPKDWGPAAIFHALRELLPPETVATADSGAHRILFSQIWRCSAPRGLLQSSGLCTMGCALPLAIGHRLGRAVPTLAVIGDAGLEMGLGELATLRDLGLPVLVVVLVDGSLALIEMKQRVAGRTERGVGIGVSDLPAVAAALGGAGAWVDGPDGLRREVAAASTRPGLSLLACRIGARADDGAF